MNPRIVHFRKSASQLPVEPTVQIAPTPASTGSDLGGPRFLNACCSISYLKETSSRHLLATIAADLVCGKWSPHLVHCDTTVPATKLNNPADFR